jgi:hypothetical protein
MMMTGTRRPAFSAHSFSALIIGILIKTLTERSNFGIFILFLLLFAFWLHHSSFIPLAEMKSNPGPQPE